MNMDDFIEDVFVRYYHNGKPTHYLVSPTNKGVYSEITRKMLKPSIKNGYHEYHLYIDGVKVTKTYSNLIGHVVLRNDNPEILTDIDHINGCKSDNDFRRLEWVTHAENNRRARKIGLNPPLRGEASGSCIYPDVVVRRCVNLLLSGKTIREVSTITQIPTGFIYGLVNGRRPDITNGITFPDTIYKHPQRNKKASKELVEKVRELHGKGMTAPEISKELGIPKQQVYNIYYYKR